MKIDRIQLTVRELIDDYEEKGADGIGRQAGCAPRLSAGIHLPG